MRNIKERSEVGMEGTEELEMKSKKLYHESHKGDAGLWSTSAPRGGLGQRSPISGVS